MNKLLSALTVIERIGPDKILLGIGLVAVCVLAVAVMYIVKLKRSGNCQLCVDSPKFQGFIDSVAAHQKQAEHFREAYYKDMRWLRETLIKMECVKSG
jgi:hypothetical protein